MPTGLFDSFDNLDQIPAEAVAAWLKPAPQLDQLENYLANKIFYPQTVPQTERDMQIDLAILREAVKMNNPKVDSGLFLNMLSRKLIVPAKFLSFVPDLATLVWVFIDALFLGQKKQHWLQDLWTIILADDIDEVVGSIILPQFYNKSGEISLKLMDKSYQIRAGSLAVIPCPKARCEIAYKLQNGKVLGKTGDAIEVYGGKLGLVVDGRSE